MIKRTKTKNDLTYDIQDGVEFTSIAHPDGLIGDMVQKMVQKGEKRIEGGKIRVKWNTGESKGWNGSLREND